MKKIGALIMSLMVLSLVLGVVGCKPEPTDNENEGKVVAEQYWGSFESTYIAAPLGETIFGYRITKDEMTRYNEDVNGVLQDVRTFKVYTVGSELWIRIFDDFDKEVTTEKIGDFTDTNTLIMKGRPGTSGFFPSEQILKRK